jgi:uncharacterized membrane protein required for colicin V production
MNDSTPWIGVLGTIATYGLGEMNHLIGIVAGCLTCALVTIQIVYKLKKK